LNLQPPALRDIDPKTLTGARRAEYDRLKRRIYHGVCRVILASLERRSRNGEALRFGDGITRIGYPGILIQSMDFEEVAAWLAIRNSQANHPCPTCLVHHDDLHKLSADADLRTSSSMRDVFDQATNLHGTQREELLKSYGLQFLEVCDICSLCPPALTITSSSFGASTIPTRTKLSGTTFSTISIVVYGGSTSGHASKNTFKPRSLHRNLTTSESFAA
jgi:hypothetical protein